MYAAHARCPLWWCRKGELRQAFQTRWYHRKQQCGPHFVVIGKRQWHIDVIDGPRCGRIQVFWFGPDEELDLAIHPACPAAFGQLQEVAVLAVQIGTSRQPAQLRPSSALEHAAFAAQLL